MHSAFTINLAVKSQTLNSIRLIQFYKQIMMLRIMEWNNKPKVTQKQSAE